MPNTDESATLLLCAGKDCARKQKTAYDRLDRAARAAGLEVEDVRCQGSCVGPTAVIDTAHGPRWFENLQSTAAAEAVVALALQPSTEPGKPLRKRELVGKKRKKAAKKLAQQR